MPSHCARGRVTDDLRHGGWYGDVEITSLHYSSRRLTSATSSILPEGSTEVLAGRTIETCGGLAVNVDVGRQVGAGVGAGVGTERQKLSTHAFVEQSEFNAQDLPVEQGGHSPPPQSVDVSSSFLT